MTPQFVSAAGLTASPPPAPSPGRVGRCRRFGRRRLRPDRRLDLVDSRVGPQGGERPGERQSTCPRCPNKVVRRDRGGQVSSRGSSTTSMTRGRDPARSRPVSSSRPSRRASRVPQTACRGTTSDASVPARCAAVTTAAENAIQSHRAMRCARGPHVSTGGAALAAHSAGRTAPLRGVRLQDPEACRTFRSTVCGSDQVSSGSARRTQAPTPHIRLKPESRSSRPSTVARAEPGRAAARPPGRTRSAPQVAVAVRRSSAAAEVNHVQRERRVDNLRQ